MVPLLKTAEGVETETGVWEGKHLYGRKTKIFKIYINPYADLQYTAKY